MADPRFNSVHLEAPRRDRYRQARDLLFNARGFATIIAERHDDPAPADSSGGGHTMIQDGPDEKALPQFWLTERDVVYPLKVGLNSVGRSNDNDVVVQDAYVSRRHCAVLVHAQRGCELHDTASKNG